MDTPIEKEPFKFRDYAVPVGLIISTILLIIFIHIGEKEVEQCPINFTSIQLENKTGYIQAVDVIKVKQNKTYINESFYKVWYGSHGWLTIRNNRSLTLCREVNESTLCIPETVYAEINLPCTPCVNITPEGNVKILNESQCPKVEI